MKIDITDPHIFFYSAYQGKTITSKDIIMLFAINLPHCLLWECFFRDVIIQIKCITFNSLDIMQWYGFSISCQYLWGHSPYNNDDLLFSRTVWRNIHTFLWPYLLFFFVLWFSLWCLAFRCYRTGLGYNDHEKIYRTENK